MDVTFFITGVPGATVEVWTDDERPGVTATLRSDGTLSLTLQPTITQLSSGFHGSVAYRAGAAVGPARTMYVSPK